MFHLLYPSFEMSSCKFKRKFSDFCSIQKYILIKREHLPGPFLIFQRKRKPECGRCQPFNLPLLVCQNNRADTIIGRYPYTSSSISLHPVSESSWKFNSSGAESSDTYLFQNSFE